MSQAPSLYGLTKFVTDRSDNQNALLSHQVDVGLKPKSYRAPTPMPFCDKDHRWLHMLNV